MLRADHSRAAFCGVCLMTAATVLIGLGTNQPAGGHTPQAEGEKQGKTAKIPGAVEVRFVDDSAMKLTLLEERIELETPHGKLLIPVADIRQIEFAWRTPEAVAKQTAVAVADLGHKDFKRRQVATKELLDLGIRAYPALLSAAKNPDPEVARRAEDLLEKLRKAVPEERLKMNPHDVVHTEHSKIAGRITLATFKVKTFQFGELQMKLSDLRSLRTPGMEQAEPVAGNALPDPGTLHFYQNQVGKTLEFRVTGAPPGLQAAAYGTGIYTTDSTLAVAAVHAGVLRPGQTGLVRVTVIGMHGAFQGSFQNGVMSHPYGAYTGFQVKK